MHWKFRIDTDYIYPSGVQVSAGLFKDAKGVERLVIEQDGTITVKSGYSWDGCSPKVRIFDLGYLGTPDGTVNLVTAKPKTYYASLVHDALYQFMADPNMKYKRRQMDGFFLDLMKKGQFSWPWRYIYFAATRIFGWIYRPLLLLLRRFNLTY